MTPGPGVVDNLCRWSFSYALNVSKFKIVDAKQTLSLTLHISCSSLTALSNRIKLSLDGKLTLNPSET